MIIYDSRNIRHDRNNLLCLFGMTTAYSRLLGVTKHEVRSESYLMENGKFSGCSVIDTRLNNLIFLFINFNVYSTLYQQL